jgi:peptide/nickel transport system substrate-binding protein
MWTRRDVLIGGAAVGASVLLPAGPASAATDQLRLALLAEPRGLDPTVEQAPATLQIAYRNLFDGLTQLDEHGVVQPGLAKSWALSPDGLTCRLALETEVRYHDGTSFDADHVVFSLKRRLAQPGGFAGIAWVTAPDAATVEIALKQPAPGLLFDLGRPDAAIVAPESADNNRAVPIGTGPFAFVEWDAGQRVVLQRNEDYWGVHPRITETIFVFIADPAAAVAALLANDVDGVPEVAQAALDAVRGNAAYRIVTGLTGRKVPRTGAWNAKLEGMWADAPIESCVLADISWQRSGAAPPRPVEPPPSPDAD